MGIPFNGRRLKGGFKKAASSFLETVSFALVPTFAMAAALNSSGVVPKYVPEILFLGMSAYAVSQSIQEGFSVADEKQSIAFRPSIFSRASARIRETSERWGLQIAASQAKFHNDVSERLSSLTARYGAAAMPSGLIAMASGATIIDRALAGSVPDREIIVVGAVSATAFAVFGANNAATQVSAGQLNLPDSLDSYFQQALRQLEDELAERNGETLVPGSSSRGEPVTLERPEQAL